MQWIKIQEPRNKADNWPAAVQVQYFSIPPKPHTEFLSSFASFSVNVVGPITIVVIL